jgi:hypothetical protein
MPVSNDLIAELKKVNINVKKVDKDFVELEKDGKVIKLEVSKIRKIFLNSLVTHIDNIS